MRYTHEERERLVNEYAERVGTTKEKASELLPNKEALVDGFVCQGKIDPKVIEMMYKMFPPGSAHGQSPERDALHKAAETHPDEQDFANAKEFTKSVLAKLQA